MSNLGFILIVERAEAVALELENFITDKGYTVVGAVNSYDEALGVIQGNHVDVVLCDVCIENINKGISFIKTIKDMQHIKIVSLISSINEKIISQIINIEPIYCFVKPFKKEDLYIALELIFKKMGGVDWYI